MIIVQFMPNAFCERFNQLLEENNIKRKTLCKLLNISPTTAYEWTNNLRVPTTTNFFKICKFFNVDPMWLYGEIDERKPYEIS